MKVEILMSCMHQPDGTLVRRSAITGDAVVINQCNQNSFDVCPTKNGTARIYSVTERGLTHSRNLAIEKSDADVCLLCDDDEIFTEDYAEKICSAYEALPDADVIILKMIGRTPSFPDRVMRLRFPKTMKVSSWQISFRRESLLRNGVRFDTLLGAGSGNGAEEELKFLCDCEKAGLRIYYVPSEIARVAQTESTWFAGFTEQFFYNRGATTRYILGPVLSCIYALYYVVKKRGIYASQISPKNALRATLRGIRDNKITRQSRENHARCP